jgi:hypothetical protein
MGVSCSKRIIQVGTEFINSLMYNKLIQLGECIVKYLKLKEGIKTHHIVHV